MRKHDSATSRRQRFAAALIFITIFCTVQTLQAQVGFKLPRAKTSLVQLEITGKTPAISMVTPFGYDGFGLPRTFSYQVEMDSSRTSYTVGRFFRSKPVFFQRYYASEDFLHDRSQLSREWSWRDFASKNVEPSGGLDNGRGGINLETGRIKSETFKRLFGGETVSLNITGRISINGTLRNEERSSARTATNRRPNTNFQMKQQQQFDVTGKIGENISVDVHQDSENAFEFENAVKLKYSSDEDGIVKSIEAGNVSLTLPGTKFVTTGQSNAGLFGLKANFQMGRLGVTAIASMEKSEKNSIQISAGSQAKTTVIDDYRYKQNTYFFLDTLYREQYTHIENGVHLYNDEYTIDDIEVYKYEEGFTEAKGEAMIYAVAMPDPSEEYKPENNDNEIDKAWFQKLEVNSDYYVHKELGYIRMKYPLQDSDILTVVYKRKNGDIIGYGDNIISALQETPELPQFKLIKAKNAQPSFKTWILEWKNVYALGIQDITDAELRENLLDVRIFYKEPGGKDSESITINGEPRTYLDLFGLDKKVQGSTAPGTDGKIDNESAIIDKERGEIIFPNLRPFDPDPSTGDYNADFWDGPGATRRNEAAYDTSRSARSYIEGRSRFYIEVNSSRPQSSFSLGINIIEGSEEVLLGAQKLIRTQDYDLEYTSGTLSLKNQSALSPGEVITVNYESQQMFSSSKKVMAGMRAEYLLWEQGGSESFIGGTFLFLDKSMIDRRIRLGKEAPMRNMVWDINTKLTRESNSFTNWINKRIGLLNLSGPSKINLEAEVAQIIPNANTLNNDKTGDHDGVAYVDDFESAKRKVPLGVMRHMWLQGSEPKATGYEELSIANMGHLVWYNPFQKVSIQDIWPDREVTTNNGGTTVTDVLTLDLEVPDSSASGSETNKKYWGSVMRGMSPGYYNQSDARFLEVWVQPNGYYNRSDSSFVLLDAQPTVYIDLGQISEDVIPDRLWNTEDIKPENGFRNDLLDDGEDSGLDGMFGDDPPHLFYRLDVAARVDTIDGKPTGVPYDFWDINHNGIKEADEPWSYDDYSYDEKRPDYPRPDVWADNPIYKGTRNGTEGNRNAGTAVYPNSEDLNGNSDVDTRNNYVRYAINLDATKDTNNVYLVSESPRHWRLYRIPLTEFEGQEGVPDWMRIENARITVTGSSKRCQASFAEIELVSNEWKYYGTIAPNDSSITINPRDEKLKLAVVNTHDNPEYKQTIDAEDIGISGYRDPVQRTLTKEQSLVMQLNDVEPGETVVARKEFNKVSFIQYKTLKMFIHGGGIDRVWGEDENAEFFLRFGADADNLTYYEITVPKLSAGWAENTIEVDLASLSRVKNKGFGAAGTETVRDTVDGIIYGVRGNPTLRNVKWLMFGVKNNSETTNLTNDIWVDELRVSSVNKTKGMAMRGKLDLTLADLFTFNSEYNSKDADFHTVNEQGAGDGQDDVSWNYRAGLNFERFFPQHWGIRIPITYSKSRSEQTPKYEPDSDILVDRDAPPDTVLTINETENWGVQYRKTTKSKNLLGKILWDPWSMSATYSNSYRRSPRAGWAQSVREKGQLSYNLSIGDKAYFKPFSFLGDKGLLAKLSALKFYAPSSLSVNLTGNNGDNDSENAGKVRTKTATSTMTRSVSSKWKVVDNLELEYSLTDDFDLQADTSGSYDSAAKKLASRVELTEFLNIIDPGIHTQKKQTVASNFSPKLAKWFTPTFRYTTDYTYNFNAQQATSGTGQSARVSTSLRSSVKVTPKDIVDLFKKKKGGRSSAAGGRGRRAPVRRQAPATGPQKDEKAESDGPTIVTKFFTGVGNVFSSIQPINVSYTERKNDTKYGLQITPDFMYQLGLTRGDSTWISDLITNNTSSWANNQSLDLSSGLKIQKNVTVTLKYNQANNISIQSDNTEKKSNSALITGQTESIPFPSWTVSWQGLEKWPILNKVFKQFKLDHAFTGKLDETFKNGSIIQDKYSKNYRPFIGGTMNFKFGMDMNFRYELTEEIIRDLQATTTLNRSRTSNIQVTAKYRMSGGLKLPFLKGKKLDNSIDFQLTFSSTDNTRDKSTSTDPKFAVTSQIKNWSIKPQADYRFSKNVTGGFHLEYGKSENIRTEDKTTFALGINAVINLSGR